MRLSLTLPSYAAEPPSSWAHLQRAAVLAEDAGFDRVVVTDHVAFGEHMDDYGNPALGGAAGGAQPTGPDGSFLDPLVTLSYLAGVTSTIRLGTNILLAALRRPVVLAKQAASLDVLSGGRLELGVGVGWQRDEYDACGLEFSDRGALLDDTLDVCETLWREARANYRSQYLAFEHIHQMPKPLQAGGVPWWISGTVHRRVVARVARHGMRWVVWGIKPVDLPGQIDRMRAGLEGMGVDAGDLQVATLVATRAEEGEFQIARTTERVKRLSAAGVTDFILPVDVAEAVLSPSSGFASPLKALTRLVEELRDAAQSSVPT